jgi:hypothetical protein
MATALPLLPVMRNRIVNYTHFFSVSNGLKTLSSCQMLHSNQKNCVTISSFSIISKYIQSCTSAGSWLINIQIRELNRSFNASIWHFPASTTLSVLNNFRNCIIRGSYGRDIDMIFWVVTQCSLVDGNQCFEGLVSIFSLLRVVPHAQFEL